MTNALLEAIKERDKKIETIREEMGIDKGPWDEEPNRVEFESYGFNCLLVRNPFMFNWCGYVGVSPNHPDYGKSYDDDSFDNIEVHGGLTYAEHCQDVICHVTEASDDRLYWFGFDCAHAGDLVPGMEASRKLWSATQQVMEEQIAKLSFLRKPIYRDVKYVKEETKRLAWQLYEREKRAAWNGKLYPHS